MKALQKNNILIVILFAIAVLMSVGFAVLSTTLNINGTAKVKASSWDIHFENVVISEGSSEAIKEAVIANEDATLVEYEVELEKPGDFYEFTVDAVNDGTIDALVNLVSLTGADSEYINYQVTYLNGSNINIGDALAAGVSETYKVRVEYKKDIDNVPNEDIKLSLVFGVTYNQGKGTNVITDYYTITGTAYDELGNPLTGGEVEVHSKVVKAPINSDGTYTLKNIQVGNHEIIIKNESGEVIGEDSFTLQTGTKFKVEDNTISATTDAKITVDVQVMSESVELTKYIKKYEAGTEVEVDTVYDFISSDKLTDTGNYTLVLANNEVIDTEVFVIDEDKIYESTPTLCSATADTKMCLIKYNGDLTINSGVTITPQVRKKGFVMYVDGTLTNNGTISMTARGAKATGQNVYLYKNQAGTFEYVPAVGGAGGASASTTGMTNVNGNAGTSGTNRKTGGGGSGAADNQYSKATSVSGAGGSGTSYSGGAGGAGIYNESYSTKITGQAGSSSGGAGGSFTGTITSEWGADGGAGNPGGTSSSSGNGENGTGGLLIIYSNDFVNKGIINSNGSKGGASGGKQEPGGSSGGGSINIFYNGTYTNSGTIVAAGGAKANFKTLTTYGGAGGAGSVTIGSIQTGTFVKN